MQQNPQNNTSINFVSGFGQYHSSNHKTNSQPYHSISFDDIKTMIEQPQNVDKVQAQWFIPSTLASRVKSEQLEQGQFHALWVDIDDAKGRTLAYFAKVLANLLLCSIWGYHTKSATQENEKCRIIIPLSEPITGESFELHQTALNNLFFADGIGADIATQRANQICYLPNRGDFYEPVIIEDKPLTLPHDLLDIEAVKQLQAQKQIEIESKKHLRLAKCQSLMTTAQSNSKHKPNQTSVINAYNESANLADLLLCYGYEQQKDKWLSPHSQSGMAGVTVVVGRTERWISSHGSDVAAGIGVVSSNGNSCSGDAFDLYCFYEHGNDRNAALRTLGELLLTPDGLSITQANQRAYMAEMDANLPQISVNLSLPVKPNQNTANLGENSEVEETNDRFSIIPEPSQTQLDRMLYGLIGEIARTAAKDNEVNPISVALAAMIWLSAEVSPRFIYLVGNQAHAANIYGLHIGRSGRGGKGESMALIKRLRERILSQSGDVLCQYHAGGLSTREGLALAIHDGYTEGKGQKMISVAPIHDKRFFLYESEFAQVLEQGKRGGNTLLTALRECWDFGSQIKPLTKGDKVWSTHPHIGLLGNVTPHELKEKLTGSDIHGGTLNRFLVVFAERTCSIPFPVATPQDKVNDLADKITQIISWAKGDYGKNNFNTEQRVIMTRTPEAEQLWLQEYERIRNPQGNHIVQATLERIAPYAWRIALLMAVLEQKTEINEVHLASGIAWIDFVAQSVKYVFDDKTGIQGLDKNQQKLLNYLAQQPNHEATKTDILKRCFNRNLSAQNLDDLLKLLISTQHIHEKKKSPESGGKTTCIYQSTTFTTFTNNVDSIDNNLRPMPVHDTTFTTTDLVEGRIQEAKVVSMVVT